MGVLAVVIAVAGVAGVMWGRDVWLARQNRAAIAVCGAYVAPQEQVVFEMQGGRITTLVPARPWAQWWTPSKDYPTVFLHQLRDRAPSGAWPAAELVAVEVEPQGMYSFNSTRTSDQRLICIAPRQVWKAGIEPSVTTVAGSTHLVIVPQEGDHLRIYAGHIVSGDPSAFSFDVEYNGQRQTVQGYLKNNQIELEPQAGQTVAGGGWTPCVFWSPAGASAEQERKTGQEAAAATEPGAALWPLPAWWSAAMPSAASKPSSSPPP